MTTESPGPSEIALCPTSRTVSLTSIASAPASRSSWMPLTSCWVPTLPGGPATVASMPGPDAGEVPARMAREADCLRARSRAAWLAAVSLWSASRDRSSWVICCSTRCSASCWALISWMRSCWDAPAYRLSTSLARTWTTAANPRRPSSTAAVTWLREGRFRAETSRSRSVSPGVAPAWASGMEHVPPDRCHVGEDADPEHHDDAGGELATDAQLVAEVDDQRGDEHV